MAEMWVWFFGCVRTEGPNWDAIRRRYRPKRRLRWGGGQERPKGTSRNFIMQFGGGSNSRKARFVERV